MDQRIKEAHDVIDEAVRRYHTDQVYVGFSGGHDSLTATHITSLHPQFKGVIHLDTTIGIPETRQFVRDTCSTHCWPLHVGRPALIWNYVNMVIRFGFPGPGQHTLCYHNLKQRPLGVLLTSLKERPGQNMIISTGMRRQESARRMPRTEYIKKEGNIIWVSPISEWTASDCSSYIQENRLKRNIVKDTMHISGECLCGCFADKRERDELRLWYPNTHKEIEKIEHIVRTINDIGIQDYKYKEQHMMWGWGSGNFERAISEAQTETQLSFDKLWSPGPMCSNCTADRVPDLLQTANRKEE